MNHALTFLIPGMYIFYCKQMGLYKYSTQAAKIWGRKCQRRSSGMECAFGVQPKYAVACDHSSPEQGAILGRSPMKLAFEQVYRPYLTMPGQRFICAVARSISVRALLA